MNKEHKNAAPARTAAVQEDAKSQNPWKDTGFYIVVKQFARNKTALLGLAIVVILILLSVFAPLIAPYDYKAVAPMNANEAPSLEHIFGTDVYGRDIFSRILWGGRYSLGVGFGSTALGAAIGIILGTFAGYLGNKVEYFIMRFCDILQNIPGTLLAMCISLTLGGGILPTMIALSVSGAVGCTRTLRAQILSIRSQEFIEAAQAIDCSKFQIMFKHVLPNSMTPLIVNISMGIGQKCLASAGLSFIGLGIQEPIPEWGAMISSGRNMLRYHPHLVIIPGIFVALVVLSFNLIGDGLRDALDPKLKT